MRDVHDRYLRHLAPLLPHLDERQRRLLAGAETRALGHGGIRVVAKAARDRDLADLGVKVDANRAAINAVGLQTAAGFEETRQGFAEMRGKLDQAAAGQLRIVDLLTGLISGQSDQP
jgi:hypothetical protein